MRRSVANLGISIWMALGLGLASHHLVLAQPLDQPPLSSLIAPAGSVAQVLGDASGATHFPATSHPEFETPLATSPPPVTPKLTYARVITGNVPVYQHPLQATLGLSPVRSLAAGYVWVSLADTQPIEQSGAHWYRINPDEYVQADYLEIYQPSAFRGLIQPPVETFAWIVFDTWTAAEPGALPGADSFLLKRYTIIPILEEQPFNDRRWYRVGEGHWIEQGMVGIVTPKPRPEGVLPGDKWIEVDLYEQTLAAYEGDQMVYATLVSSGLPWWRTEPGLFQVWVKVRQAKMSGREGYADYYFLEDVPWSMYFNGNFSLHGAYWHDRFGIRHSHGCVNLPLADAKWLFEWATPVDRGGWTLATEENVGTWVWVHE